MYVVPRTTKTLPPPPTTKSAQKTSRVARIMATQTRTRRHHVTVVVMTLTFASSGETRTSNSSSTRQLPVESTERRLVNELLSAYNSLGAIVRPVVNTSDTVHVEFGLGLIQMDLLEKENILFMSAWTRYSWLDQYLRWDPEDYDNITYVKLPSESIWNPDIMLYNTASTTVHTRPALAVIRYDGRVRWYPHRVFESTCSIDVRYFPFDNQTCHMFFGSWTHTAREINVSLAFAGGIDLSTIDMAYNDCNKWQIIAVDATTIVSDPDYVQLRFELHLQRKMMFSSYILTVPAVFLSFLTLVVFALPSDDVEKSQLGLAIFGSLLLLLLIVVEAAPPTASAVPLLGIFYCFTTVIVIMSVFLTAIVVKIGNAGSSGKNRPLPKLMKTIIIRGLGTFLCSRHANSSGYPKLHLVSADDTCPGDVQQIANGYTTSSAPSSAAGEYTRVPRHLSPTSEHNKQDLSEVDVSDVITHCADDKEGAAVVSMRILSTLTSIGRLLKDKHAAEDLSKNCEREWRDAAAILDRLFFWLNLVAIVASMVFLFPWKL